MTGVRNARSVRKYLYKVAALLPGGLWLVRWFDPLHLARKLLYQSIADRVHYAQGRMLDIGCGVKPYRSLFSNVETYVGLDMPSVLDADIYGDGQFLPFRSESFNTVLCNQVLEHVPEPSRLMREVGRVLRPNGVLILTTPQTWGLHLEPYDFYRYTRYGLHYLANQAGLEVIEIVPTSGLWATLAQRLADTMAHTYTGYDRPGYLAVRISAAPVLLVGYLLDRIFGLQGDTLDNVLVARKPA